MSYSSTYSGTIPVGISVTPVVLMLQYFNTLFRNPVARLYDQNAVLIDTIVNVSITVKDNKITIVFEYTPKDDICVAYLEVDVDVPGAVTKEPLLYMVFGTTSPTASPLVQLWLRKGVTYRFEIVVSYDIPSSTEVTAPTGICRSGVPVS